MNMVDNKKQNNKKGISFWGWPCAVAAATFLLDQASKVLIDMLWPVGWQCRIIPGLFNLVHWRNTGCAWGFLNEHTWLLALLSLAAFVAVLFLFRSQNGGDKVVAFAIALLEGGIAGNMVDRIFRNSVIDFLDFYVGSSHWPAFNIADSAICVSIAIIIYCNIRQAGRKDA